MDPFDHAMLPPGSDSFGRELGLMEVDDLFGINPAYEEHRKQMAHSSVEAVNSANEPGLDEINRFFDLDQASEKHNQKIVHQSAHCQPAAPPTQREARSFYPRVSVELNKALSANKLMSDTSYLTAHLPAERNLPVEPGTQTNIGRSVSKGRVQHSPAFYADVFDIPDDPPLDLAQRMLAFDLTMLPQGLAASGTSVGNSNLSVHDRALRNSYRQHSKPIPTMEPSATYLEKPQLFPSPSASETMAYEAEAADVLDQGNRALAWQGNDGVPVQSYMGSFDKGEEAWANVDASDAGFPLDPPFDDGQQRLRGATQNEPIDVDTWAMPPSENVDSLDLWVPPFLTSLEDLMQQMRSDEPVPPSFTGKEVLMQEMQGDELVLRNEAAVDDTAIPFRATHVDTDVPAHAKDAKTSKKPSVRAKAREMRFASLPLRKLAPKLSTDNTKGASENTVACGLGKTAVPPMKKANGTSSRPSPPMESASPPVSNKKSAKPSLGNKKSPKVPVGIKKSVGCLCAKHAAAKKRRTALRKRNNQVKQSASAQIGLVGQASGRSSRPPADDDYLPGSLFDLPYSYHYSKKRKGPEASSNNAITPDETELHGSMSGRDSADVGEPESSRSGSSSVDGIHEIPRGKSSMKKELNGLGLEEPDAPAMKWVHTGTSGRQTRLGLQKRRESEQRT